MPQLGTQLADQARWVLRMADGIQAVRARIAEIESHFAVRTSPALSAQVPTTVDPGERTFASSLSAATGVSNTALTPAARKVPGTYGTMRVPAELRRYGNGRIPAQALTSIGVGDYRLSRDAATAFVRMRSDAAAAGVNIGVEDSYRSFDEQVDLAHRKGLYSQGGLAATPGTSNHGWGLAVDISVDARGRAWMTDNASRYGFVEDTPREPWHWGYRPTSASS
jgi:D-alanyl-D-alanine carboxypeptidase